MATRTAQGTASSKSSGTTLTISSVTVPQGHALVVGVSCENGQLAPTTVTHNGKTLKRRQQQDNAVQGYHTSAWLKGGYKKAQTGDVVATWAGAIVERAMVASSWDLEAKKDDGSGLAETSPTANPGTGQTGAVIAAGSFVVELWYEINTIGTTDFTAIGAASNTVGVVFQATGVGSGTGDAREGLDTDGTIAICFFGSNGPVEDHASATADIENAGTFASATVGQKDGTTGGGAATNVTVIETFLEISGHNVTRGRLQGATPRRWADVILVLQPRPLWYTQGITTTDIGAVDDIVDGLGGNTDNVYYQFDEDTGRWLAYETATPGTLRATRDETGAWI